MNSAELGRKIREARLAKKLTQAEVVGDFITRNMLSQIESGTAYPSIKTLEFLSNALNLPLQTLIPMQEQGELTESDGGMPVLLQAKQAFLMQDFETVLLLMSPLAEEEQPLFDEACALLARAHLQLAQQKADEGQTGDALRHAHTAQEYSKKGVYAGREVRTAALLLLDSMADKLEADS